MMNFLLAYIHVNDLIRGSHPGTKYGGILTYPGISGARLAQKYPEISGPNMVISIFAMTVQPKQHPCKNKSEDVTPKGVIIVVS